MKFQKLKQTIIHQFKAEGGHRVVPFIVGQPGGGKSACAREIAHELQDIFNIPDSRVVEFNPSLRDPVDLLGVPFKSEDGTHSEWLPPAEFYAIRAGQGPSILILEELSDASMTMQNPLCRVILDRCAGQMRLSEQLFIIATGNRVEDKSGANRLSTKLGNRTRMLSFESDVEDWIEWAASHGISPMITSFIKFRPNLLCDFDPKRTVNPTPRSWEDISRIPEDMDALSYFEHCKGAIGEGAAAEYTAFLKVAQEMPDPKEVLKSPKKYNFNDFKADVKYALTGAIEGLGNKKNMKQVKAFVDTIPPEFGVMVMVGLYRRDRSVGATKEFTDWAIANGRLMKGV